MIIDLTDDEARQALVLKWGTAEPGVLPAWVAEMDYARRRRWSRRAARGGRRGVTGYPAFDARRPSSARRTPASRGGTSGRAVDPDQVLPIVDVTAGRPARPRRALRAGRRWCCRCRPTTRSTGSPRSPDASEWTCSSTPTPSAPARPRRARPAVRATGRGRCCSPSRTTRGAASSPAPSSRGSATSSSGTAPGWSATRSTRPLVLPGRRARPLPVARGHRRPRGRGRRGVQGVQHRRPQVRPDRRPATTRPATGCVDVPMARNDSWSLARRRRRASRPTTTATPGWPRWSSGSTSSAPCSVDLLAEHLPEARMRPLEATYLAWLDLRAYGHDDPAAVLLERGRVRVVARPRLPPRARPATSGSTSRPRRSG